MSQFRSYLWLLALIFATGVFCAVGFVFAVDPYGLYRAVKHPGANPEKPYPTRYLAEIKVARAMAQEPNALILGNSRAEMGFDPEHEGFKSAGYNAYNLAMPSGDTEEFLVMLRELRQKKVTPRRLLAGVDFMDFAASAIRNAPLASNLTTDLRWRFDTLFSLTSVTDAFKTIRMQANPEMATIAATGVNLNRDTEEYARRDGYYVMFRQRAEENARQYLWWNEQLTDARIVNSLQFAALRELVQTAARDQIALDLVIYPYHAQLFALYQASGVWPRFEQWKDAVAAEVAAAKARYPDAKIRLWDFSGFGGARCEKIPPRGDRGTVTRWYWEGAHFKKDLGDLMLDQILLGKADSQISGALLVPEVLKQNRERLAAERLACAAANPELFDEAQEMIQQARQVRMHSAALQR